MVLFCVYIRKYYIKPACLMIQSNNTGTSLHGIEPAYQFPVDYDIIDDIIALSNFYMGGGTCEQLNRRVLMQRSVSPYLKVVNYE